MSAVLTIAGLYGIGHLSAYLIFLRHRPAFRRERTIFLYHAVSFLGVMAMTALMLAQTREPGVAAVAAIILSVHGIYSLSFLELWSLAEGGYSLTILRRAAARRQAVDPPSLAALESVGVTKRAARLQQLADLGLVERRGPTWSLTSRGRFAAAAVKAVSWLVRVQRRG
jgi:hypothetical protein